MEREHSTATSYIAAPSLRFNPAGHIYLPHLRGTTICGLHRTSLITDGPRYLGSCVQLPACRAPNSVPGRTGHPRPPRGGQGSPTAPPRAHRRAPECHGHCMCMQRPPTPMPRAPPFAVVFLPSRRCLFSSSGTALPFWFVVCFGFITKPGPRGLIKHGARVIGALAPRARAVLCHDMIWNSANERILIA